MQWALEGTVPPEHIYGPKFTATRLRMKSVRSEGNEPDMWRVAVLEELETDLWISSDRTVYVGDG